jgi:AcrR family transcriptional regulator
METQMQINRRDQIIFAAREVFANQGYSKASIKKIAAQAELNSPALIYWYFDNKADLFAAVLADASLMLHEISSNYQLEELAPQEALTILAQCFIDTFESPTNKRIFRILISESMNNPEVSDHFAETVILPVRDFLIPYFQQKMDAGLLRPHDPDISARAFAGMLVHAIFCDEIFPQLRNDHPLSDEYIQEIVRIFLDGLNAVEAQRSTWPQPKEQVDHPSS